MCPVCSLDVEPFFLNEQLCCERNILCGDTLNVPSPIMFCQASLFGTCLSVFYIVGCLHNDFVYPHVCVLHIEPLFLLPASRPMTSAHTLIGSVLILHPQRDAVFGVQVMGSRGHGQEKIESRRDISRQAKASPNANNA